MINFKILVEGQRYYIQEIFTGSNKKELPARYIKKFIYIFGEGINRLPRLSKLFKHLVDSDEPIVISEYDLLQMIRTLYTCRYNIEAGKWLIDYYQEGYKYAFYELQKILPS